MSSEETRFQGRFTRSAITLHRASLTPGRFMRVFEMLRATIRDTGRRLVLLRNFA